mmetsp:Transcript_38878/g.122456  ORF Transcript_38878/g.122456 Transcript_38878/m.122456 type:complete len:292 (-) Transcript_38878:85-960(-)
MPALSQARPGRRRGARAGRRVAVVASAVLAVALLSAAARGFAGPGARAAPAGRQASAVVRSAAERAAYIAVVDVNVTAGGDEAFLAASLENARNSVKEDDNKRFDVLQSQEDPNNFVLVEIYGSAEGPAAHKGTDHYLSWRDAVADLMGSPRQASQWDTVFPKDASSYSPDVILLEREESVYMDISHVSVDVKPGQEEDFIEASIRMAKETLKEDASMRLDILRSPDDPTKFLMIEVFRRPEDTVMHRRSDHFARWRDTVAGMMATPRTFKRYVNQFPNLPAGWKVDPGVQ